MKQENQKKFKGKASIQELDEGRKQKIWTKEKGEEHLWKLY